MGREPREYTIWGRIVKIGANRYSIHVSAKSVEFEAGEGGKAAFTENAEAATRLEARHLLWSMIRTLSARLTAAGNTVSHVETDI